MHAERLLLSKCTKFGADSSSRFPFRARTNRQTNKQTRRNALYSRRRWQLRSRSAMACVTLGELGTEKSSISTFIVLITQRSCELTSEWLRNCCYRLLDLSYKKRKNAFFEIWKKNKIGTISLSNCCGIEAPYGLWGCNAHRFICWFRRYMTT